MNLFTERNRFTGYRMNLWLPGRKGTITLLISCERKVKVKVTLSCLTLCDPTSYTVHGILQGRILEWVAFPFSRRSSQPRSLALQVNSLPAEPKGRPKNTEMCSLSLLQRIFLTQESNHGLLHYRRILYHLNQKASPRILEWVVYPLSKGSS